MYNKCVDQTVLMFWLTCTLVICIGLMQVFSCGGSFYFLYSSLENSEAKEYYAEIQRILNQMGVAHSERKSKKRVQSPAPSVTEDR